MQPRLLLRRIAQRACTPGVLQSNQLGAVIHALRQLDCLNVRSNQAIYQLVKDLVDDADARSVANVLHGLALSTREQCSPRTALPEGLQETLMKVQRSMIEVTDDLTAPESIMVTEALLLLCVYGAKEVIHPRLLRELQSRTMALVHAVERPVELLGILRVALEARRTPIPMDAHGAESAKLSSANGDASHQGRTDHGERSVEVEDGEEEDLLTASRRAAESEELREWGEETLRQLVAAIEARLSNWSRQELITLMDTITSAPAHTSREGGNDSAHPSQEDWTGHVEGAASPHRMDVFAASPAFSAPPRHLIDATRPLAMSVLNRTMHMVPQLSAGQCSAWLARLASLGLAEDPLLPLVVRRLRHAERGAAPAKLMEEMSASQLATSATALALILGECQPPSPSLDRWPSRVKMSMTDQDDMLALFVALFAKLVDVADEKRIEPPAPLPLPAHSSAAFPSRPRLRQTNLARARADLVFLVTAHLPEGSLVGFLRRRQDSGAALAFQEAALLQSFANALARGCSLLLRHWQELAPAELVRLACTVLHWHVFSGAWASWSGEVRRSSDLPPPSALSSSSSSSSSSSGSGFDVLAHFPPHTSSPAHPSGGGRRDDEEAAAAGVRKLSAFAALLLHNLPRLNMIDLLQLVNEGTTALHEERGALMQTSSRQHSTSHERWRSPEKMEPSRDDLAKQSVETLQHLAMSIHKELQLRFAESGVNVEASRQLQRHQRAPRNKRASRGPRQDSRGPSGHVAPSPPNAHLTAADLSTTHLCRYLTSLSKLNIRTVAEYYTVLHLVQGRPLTPFELLSVLYVVARHHLKAPYLLSGCVRRLPELAECLSSSQKALLLKYLGQVSAQRFVRSPSYPPLELGNFFRDASELAELTYLEAVFAFNGLMDLRQFENATLCCLLQDPLAPLAHRRVAATPAAAALPLNRTLDFVQSATTLCEFVVSLCRLGVPRWMGEAAAIAAVADLSDAAHPPPSPLPTYEQVSLQLMLTRDALRAATRAMHRTRSLFTDVAQLTTAWPVLTEFSHVFREAAREAMPGLTRGERDTLEEKLEAVEAEWGRLSLAVQAQLRHRVADIARDPSLRPNSFLVGQLAGAVCFRALPTDELTSSGHTATSGARDPSDEAEHKAAEQEVRRLFDNVELKKLPQLLGNARSVVDAAIIGIYASRLEEQHGLPCSSSSLPTTALSPPQSTWEALLAFVRKHMLSLRVQDVLSVWWLCEQALHGRQLGLPALTATTAGERESERPRRQRAPQSAAVPTSELAPVPAAVRGYLTSIRAAARTHFQEEHNVAKLSPLEYRVLQTLL